MTSTGRLKVLIVSPRCLQEGQTNLTKTIDKNYHLNIMLLLFLFFKIQTQVKQTRTCFHSYNVRLTTAVKERWFACRQKNRNIIMWHTQEVYVSALAPCSTSVR